ncbi:MFS transporter [Demetria terragena]|uniref:MFS transporter n=1 Tax=Demetria terragena TaxID=63959 RepID=UPI001FDEBE56|nr:MFS transporter [Demetria terragena]
MTIKHKIDGGTRRGSEARLPQPVKVLLLARFVNRLGAFSMPFLAALLVHERGASVTLAGAVMGIFGIATIPSRLIGGRLATRVGTKNAVILGLAGTAGSQLIIAWAPSLAVAVIGAALLGLCFEIYEPASQGLVADVTPENLLPRAYGLLGAALSAAGLAAGLFAATIGRLGLSWLFVFDAATAIAGMVVVALLLHPARQRANLEENHGPAPSPWRDHKLWLLMVTGTGFAMIYLVVPMVMPLALGLAGWQASDAGLLNALSALVVIAAQPVLRKTGNLRVRSSAGYGLLAIGLAMAGSMPNPTGYVIAVVVMALGDVLLLGYSYALVARIAPTGAKAQYFAVYGITWGVALTLGPPLMGFLLHMGPSAMWFTCAGAMTATGLAQLRITRHIARPIENN